MKNNYNVAYRQNNKHCKIIKQQHNKTKLSTRNKKMSMRESHRVYLKHKVYKNRQPNQSVAFRSSVQRSPLDVALKPKQEPGPGSYQLTLPLIKPKYEAIFKNNRSIIIKVNDIPVPAFCTREARFKQYSTIESKQQEYDTLDLRELQKQSSIKKNSRRYNFLLAKRRMDDNLSSSMVLTNNNTDTQNIKQKGAQWSKYREQRKVWKNPQNIPGPGSYSQVETAINNQLANRISWQFRSQTKRSISEKNSNRGINSDVGKEESLVHSIHSRHNLLENQY